MSMSTYGSIVIGLWLWCAYHTPLFYKISVKIGGTKFTKCTCSTGRRTAVSGGKKGAAATCKACRGMPVVDGIGISAGMISTPGLELTNFIDPKLTWTKAAKGNRSARHAKRPSRNSAVDQALENGKTMDDKTVSESEKLGVAVLGQRFGNMIEHVPLKKRMTMFQSPSPPPPQTPSPKIEVSEQKHSHPNSPDEQLPSATNFDGNASEASKEKNGFFEDFSGIEMLATAACDNTLVNGICHAEDGHSVQGGDSAPSAVPLENTEVSSKDTCLEVKTEVSPVRDNPICFSDKSTHEKDEMNVDESSTSRDSRLHWDLNVPMDAWEQPCESAFVDFDNSVPKNRSADGSEKLLTTFQINEAQQDIKLENVHCSSIAHEENKVSPYFGDLPLGTSGLGTEENRLKACSGGGCTRTEEAQEPLAGAETSMEDSSNSRPIDGTDEQKPEGFVQVEGSHVSIANVSCEAESTVLNEDTVKLGRNSGGEKISTGSFQSPEPVPDEVEPTRYVVEVVLPRSSPNYEDKFKSPAVDGTGHHADNAVTSSDPPSSSGKGNKEDRSDASCSCVYQDRKSHFGVENSTELQAGYDSQIEDGELREPYLRCWEENEEDDDTQFLDYGSECEEQSLETEIDEKKMNVDRGLTPGSDNVSLRTKHAEVTDTGKVKNHADDLMDGPNCNSKDYSSRVPGLRAPTDKNRSDFADNCYPRAERQMRDGSAFHMHGMGEYNSYNGSYGGPRRFRPKSDIEGRGYIMSSDRTFSESSGFAGPNRRTRRPYLGSCNDLQRPFMMKQSPIDRHGGTYGGGQSMKDFSPDRHKFKRYPQGINRGEYHRPMLDESNEYANNRIPHCLTRRDHSLSPVSGGRYYYTQDYKKSRSRSRSRSPVPILLPREWNNEGSRNRSRSPRMDKVRFPFQKRFVADCDDEDIACEPRGRFSTQHNSRWFDDRSNNGVDNFRSRKSPGRMMKPNQRFNSIRRKNSDDYVRPMGQARRFPPDVADGPGRGGFKYESSDDDRRKYNNRYKMFPRARRFDTDGGPVRRFITIQKTHFPLTTPRR